MCLATVYKESDNTVICRNVSRIDVDGEYVLIRDILEKRRGCRGGSRWWIWPTALCAWSATDDPDLRARRRSGNRSISGPAGHQLPAP